MTPEEALQKAKEVCGSATELGRRIGVTVQAIGQWKVAPAKRALAIERATEGQVPKEQLCPDMYPQENSEAA
jgi:DNA-binding transcriptional regulator YdaS (Cro superfamily)